MFRQSIGVLALVFGTACLSAQFAFTADATPHEDDGRSVVLTDLTGLQKKLLDAPSEFSREKSSVTIELPLPNGNTAVFQAYDSPVIKGRPEFGSYLLRGPWGGGRLAISAKGVAGIAKGPDGYFILDPLDQAGGLYRSVSYTDLMRLLNQSQGPLRCGFNDEEMPDYAELAEAIHGHDHGNHSGADAGAAVGLKSGGEARELRVYDLIMTNTVEFANRVGGGTDDVQAAFNEAVTIINGIFEIEIGIRINLIDEPSLVITDDNLFAFTNPADGRGLLNQVIEAFNNRNVTPDRYDLGHIFTIRCDDGLGGVVSGRACTSGKTRGVTCVSGSVAGAAIRIMAHEVAHQFTVSHSWNNCPSLQNQRAGNRAFEPGSGTTIMSYAGSCGNQNIGSEQSYYHVGSLEQFLFYTREGGAADCAEVIPTDNVTPQVELDYEDGFSIPISTPFKLEGRATDPNPGDVLTYTWEQYDLGPAVDVRDPRGNAPLFRTFAPSREGNVRYFPRLDRVINNTVSISETLPTYSRDMTFRLTARDNNPEAGGVDWEEVAFFASDQAGPFRVGDAPAVLRVGDYREIRWDVANTDQAPVNCRRVNILLSTNRGLSFDEVLVRNVPNTGSAFVTIPAGVETFDGLLMVEAADNVFFNVNKDAFRISGPARPTFTIDTDTRVQQLCLPEVGTFNFNTQAIAGFDTTITLSVDMDTLPAGLDVRLSANQVEPGEDVTLEVDMTDIRYSGPLEVTLVAVSGSLDTARRTVLLEVVDNDFTDLMTTAPAEGTTGIILSTDFDWTEAANADEYDIQIATDPTFSNDVIFEEAFGVDMSQYPQQRLFDPNTLYFWRVRPVNRCGPGEWLSPNSFRTVNSACRTVETEEGDELRLPGSGAAFERESVIFVEEQGIINDINIPGIDMDYSFASNVTLSLTSPAGTTVVLYQENCFSTNKIEIGFDDDAPSAIPCPPDDRRVFRPVGDLSAFNGEDTFGEWIMTVAVSETGGSVGTLNSWGMEFCSDIQSSAPDRTINVPTEVRPNMDKTVEGSTNLRTISDVYTSQEIVYTLTSLPNNGVLYRYQTALVVGDTFRQADLNGRGIVYENTNPDAETDEFGFVTTTPNSGYLGVSFHDIIITADATVSNRNASPLDQSLEVFPNPASDYVGIRWHAAINRPVEVALFDVNGRLLSTRVVDGAAKQATLRVAELPSGIYLLRVDGAVRRLVRN